MATEEPVLDRTSKKNMTMFRIFLSILLISGFFLIGERAKAQTCRVNIGVSAAGCTSYMEVFEYDYVSEKPSFPGGDAKMMTFVNEHRCYPHEAYRRGVQGRVTCSFVVNTDGSISHISVLRGVEPSLTREAIRVIGIMPPWTPGKIDGKAVPTRVVRSVNFRR